MALSNYDQFVVNHKGESCFGEFVSPLEIKVKVYKNWLNIEDEFGWQEETGYSKPIVSVIYNGHIKYKDINIACTQRTVKNDDITIFCVWSGWSYLNDVSGIVGICQYGDIKPEAIKKLKSTLNKEFDVDYCVIPDIFKDINFNTGKRCNQGDVYFHNRLGTDIQYTDPGETKDTMFEKLLGLNECE